MAESHKRAIELISWETNNKVFPFSLNDSRNEKHLD
jgi:hypothetical protein